jgi:hypothetical protein
LYHAFKGFFSCIADFAHLSIFEVHLINLFAQSGIRQLQFGYQHLGLLEGNVYGCPLRLRGMLCRERERENTHE